MFGNDAEISFFSLNFGPLSFGLDPNHFVLGAQLAPGEKRVSLYP